MNEKCLQTVVELEILFKVVKLNVLLYFEILNSLNINVYGYYLKFLKNKWSNNKLKSIYTLKKKIEGHYLKFFKIF